jgi:2-keto-3-deoxy-L-rhamnonate aldolase RhmA
MSIALRENKLKRMLRDGRVSLGCGINESRDQAIVFALARGGADMVFIDLEHQPLGIGTVSDLIGYSHAAGITPVVRISQIDYASVTPVLDAGCQSLFVPGVKTPEEVERLLDMARYGPLGNRGMNMYGNANVSYFEVTDVAAAAEWMNNNLLIGLNIETREAVENLEDMLMPGIDWALVGLYDLSQSYGILGQHASHPLIREAMEKVQGLCAERGIAYATFVGQPDQIPQAVANGASMVLMGGVLDFVRRGTRQASEMIAEANRATG